MESYYPIKKLSYIDSFLDKEEEYNKRKNSYATINTDLDISTINPRTDTKKTFELFCVPIPEITFLLNKLRENSKDILFLIEQLPGVFQNLFFNRCLVEEIKTTNEIENIKTTREEINIALSHVDTENEDIKLLSFVKQYHMIMNKEKIEIKKLSDIRDYYDSLLKDEISEDIYPDGELFRNNCVRIGNEVKTVHTPKAKETEITEQLESWLKFSNREDVDPIIKAILLHYYFEYVHPFYDGNGRLGRFILVYQIQENLDEYTALSLSSILNENKSKYYSELHRIEISENYGEGTFFVTFILKILKKGQEKTLEILKEYNKQLHRISNKLDNSSYDRYEKHILFIMFQNYIFNNNKSMKDNDLIDIFQGQNNLSKTKLKEYIKLLTNKEVLIKTMKRPLQHKLNPMFVKEFLNNETSNF